MEFSEGKCQVLHWRQITPHTNTYCRLPDLELLESRFFKKDLKVLVVNMLIMSQCCDPVAKKANSIRDCVR